MNYIFMNVITINFLYLNTPFLLKKIKKKKEIITRLTN